MNLLLSIIIPSYNQGKFIKKTIDSILNQSYKNIEVIVIDGGSSDTTIDILKSFGNKILWISEKDRGQAHAINKGTALAKGDIIAYLNSDDYYLQNTLCEIIESFEKNPTALWLTGDYAIVNEKEQDIQSLVIKHKKLLRNYLSFNLLSILNPISQPSTFLRRELLEKVGLFNEELHYTMDYDYWMRCIQIQKPYVITKPISAFRIHPLSKGGSQFEKQFKEGLNVARNYQKKVFYIILHRLHNFFIILMYKIIK